MRHCLPVGVNSCPRSTPALVDIYEDLGSKRLSSAHVRIHSPTSILSDSTRIRGRRAQCIFSHYLLGHRWTSVVGKERIPAALILPSQQALGVSSRACAIGFMRRALTNVQSQCTPDPAGLDAGKHHGNPSPIIDQRQTRPTTCCCTQGESLPIGICAAGIAEKVRRRQRCTLRLRIRRGSPWRSPVVIDCRQHVSISASGSSYVCPPWWDCRTNDVR